MQKTFQYCVFALATLLFFSANLNADVKEAKGRNLKNCGQYNICYSEDDCVFNPQYACIDGCCMPPTQK